MTTAKRTVFLDVDGVLNRVGFCWSREVPSLDAGMLSEFCGCVVSLAAEVVVHSSWRESGEKMSQLRDALSELGVRIAGVTRPGINKVESVLEYVASHDVGDWVVVDDDDYSVDFHGRFVRTLLPGRIGFTKDVRDSMIEMFGGFDKMGCG